MTQPEQEAREMLARETARRIQGRVAAGDVDLRDVAQLCGEAWDQDMLAYMLAFAARPTVLDSSEPSEEDVARVSLAMASDPISEAAFAKGDNKAGWEILARIAFAARPTAGIDREAIAQVIDPPAFGNSEILRSLGSFDERPHRQRTALTKADAILALFPTPAKTGERGAVIEECARIADERAAGRAQLFEENGASINAAKAVEAEEIAKAIRALSQPLPDTPIVSGEGEES